jgi:hypothetical protein
MEFVVEEEAEEDDGTRVEETPQVHSANEVVAGAHELDVQVVVPSTAAENTPTRIPESLEAQRTTINVSRQEDKTLQPESIMSGKEWQRAAPNTADPLLDNSKVGAEQTVSLITKENTSFNTVQGALNEKVFPTTAPAVGTQSTTLSFVWAMVDQVYTVGVDGLYHDQEGMRYHRLGVEGQYMYEQVASVLQEGLDVDRVTSPVAMVTNVLCYVTAETPPPPEIHELLGGELLDDDT